MVISRNCCNAMSMEPTTTSGHSVPVPSSCLYDVFPSQNPQQTMASIMVAVPGAKRSASAVEDERARQQQDQDDNATSDERSSLATPQPAAKRCRVADNARVRSAKACQRCRRLKEKCDGLQPCARCTRSGRDCEFAPPGVTGPNNNNSGSSTSRPGSSSTRARSSGSAGAAASLAHADSVRSEERTKCLERLVQHLLGDVPMDLNNLRRMAEKAGQRGGPSSDVSSSIRADTEDLDDLTLEDENFTVKTLSQSTAHYSGEFSHWNFSQKLRRRLGQCLDSDVAIPALKKDLRNGTGSMAPPPGRNLRRGQAGMRIMEYWRATQLQSPKTLVQSVLHCLPPRAVSTFLVQIYFRFAQVNCFYAEESWVKKKLDFVYEAPGHVTSEDSAWVCSVLMVLAIGTQFAHMAAGPLNDGDGVNGSGSGSRANTTSLPGDGDSDVGVTFYQMASKLIPDIITIASMESVQACLLLAHYALPLDTHGLAYTYLGLGIKMAIQNGMHRRYTGTDLDAWTIETRNRLWWTAYTVERRVSVLHGRPASISPTEVDAELPKDLTRFKQHDEVSNIRNMSALIDMTLRLGDVACAITLLRRCPKNLQPTYFERIVDICQSLRAWWSSLPADVQSSSPSSPLFRSNVHLKLCLHLNDIFVGRPFIFSQASGASPAAMSSTSTARRTDTTGSPTVDKIPSSPSQDRPRNRAALVSRAVEAAMSVIDLLRTLHETTGLARSSYTEFSSCRAALLVMLAQSVNGPQPPELRAAIDHGMTLIRRMAAGSASTQSETSVIEALEIAVRRLQDVPNACGEAGEGAGEDEAGRREHRGQTDAGKSGYERFREWASLWPPPGAEVHDATALADARNAQPFGGGAAELAGWPSSMAGEAEQSLESVRWNVADPTRIGIDAEQLDDLGLFGGFPELGALDGWPGLT